MVGWVCVPAAEAVTTGTTGTVSGKLPKRVGSGCPAAGAILACVLLWGIQGRPAPGALTYGLIEGLIMQGMVQGTGLALLEVHKKMLAPVVAGDTIWADIEVTGVRPTSQHNRAVVSSTIDVFNQHGKPVMAYTATRMLAGRPD